MLTVDVTRVVSEEDTSKGSESTHQVCLEGDGRLNGVEGGRHGRGVLRCLVGGERGNANAR